MAGRAEPGAQSDARTSLVRLGHLCFDDFLLLGKRGLSGESSSFEGLYPFPPELTSDWALALNNAPHILLHFCRSDAALASSLCTRASDFVPALEDIRAAQSRLVLAFAYDLLRAKAPPLYDALPWHDWDFSIVARRFKLWQTRFLLAGDGTTVTMCRCRKTAGVYVVEPDETIARYTETKAALEKVRRFRLLPPSSSSPNPQPLAPVPLPDASVDLAIIGSVPSLETGHWSLVTREMRRISRNVLLVENNPLAPPLDEKLLNDAGFLPDSVAVSGLGPRRCWWKRT
jgi:hypothetical protein